ncbi:long-chain acyl-CoA synthetase [Longimycelium tulufanense]|uniref:Acyl-CoA synthetase n=1 Tax=Longimycelium tulufanense TaxID=907463 RepID=A0A8J3CDX1_9PSEU|nr:AMP-dependent synthetase/ligase [Longimycelium tulufanense]GGM80306.1 long-chain acyl-CoA synthetase [Longimycelium tulufanense]
MPTLDVSRLADLASAAGSHFADDPAIRSVRPSRWSKLTYRQLAEVVRDVARGLIALGVEPGDHVAILAETRPEWTVCDLAALAAGAVVVPVYPTNSPAECEWVLTDSGTSLVICENSEQLAKVAALAEKFRALVVMEEGSTGGALDLDELVAKGKDVDPAEPQRRAAAVRPESPATIIYTSGTTGSPKGCVITNANWAATFAVVRDSIPVPAGDVVYLYLPLAHMLARIVQIEVFRRGGVLHFFGGDVRQVVAELAQVRPRFLPSVPRLFEKVHHRVLSMLDQVPPDDRDAFRRALELGRQVRGAQRRGEEVPAEVREEFAEADARWLAMVRAAFGGQLEGALTGAAPIAPEVLEFFDACGIPILEGYGLTESTAVISINTLEARKIGTVGRPVPGVEVRIADDGEVLARGDNMFAGYHGDPESTARALADGWLHTGDLGEIDEDGFLRITGRKKELIIPASGKNISPNPIENDLRQSRWISHAVLHGDRRPYLVALVTLEGEEILPWARERGLPEDLAQLAGHPAVRALVQSVVDEVNARYSRPEQVRAFAVLGHDFGPESGELTPTLKLRRSAIAAKYRDVLDKLYVS